MRCKRTIHLGVSLIEMLIVIAIIGSLIAFLIPAIQAVRDSAKKVQNQNNMRQILLAIHDYVSSTGNLPQTASWPGEACGNGNSSYSGPWFQNGWTLTQTNCSNTVVEKSVSVWQNGAWLTPPTTTLNKVMCRSDWTEGSPYFLLMPYLDQQAIWDQSYGPMSSGTVTQAGGAAGLVVSGANFGWQGGRVPSLVKTLAASGDPTIDYPGMLAPLSYPMFKNFTGSIENYNTAYQAMITEQYAGCSSGGKGTYNSWAGASTYVNLDFASPLMPSYTTVSWGQNISPTTSLVWTGIKTADTKCDTVSLAYDACGDADITCQEIGIAAEAQYCSCQGIINDPVFPPALNNILGLPITTFCNSGGDSAGDWQGGGHGFTGLGHIPLEVSYPIGIYRSNNDPHAGEWYYQFSYVLYGINSFWLDHPNPIGCPTGLAMSMVPGSLNLGMMDGSVRSITTDLSFGDWSALLSGQAPTDDINNW